MKIPKSNNFKPRKLIPVSSDGSPKTYNSLFVGYYYIGTQRQDFKGEVTEQPKIILAFDIPKVRVEWDGKDCPARMNSFSLTLSIGKKASLRKFLRTLMGRDLRPADEADFNLDNYLGTPIGVTIEHYTNANGDLRDKIGGYAPVDEDKEIPKLETKTFGLTCIDEVSGEPIIPTKENGWPQWVIQKCYESLEFQAAIQAGKIAALPGSSSASQGSMTVIDDDDTPF